MTTVTSKAPGDLPEASHAKRKALWKHTYAQVLFAIFLGALVGSFWPDFASNPWFKACGDGFVKLIKMLIGPIIFFTVVSGVSHVGDAKKVGRVGLKAMVYFEIISTFSLMIGMTVGNVAHPGLNFGGSLPDAAAVAGYAKAAQGLSAVDMVLHIIPDTAVGAFASGDVLQILLFSILFGFALQILGDKTKVLHQLIVEGGQAIFKVVGIVTKVAPIGAGGAMAYTIGKYGAGALGSLFGLIGLFYLTAALFVFIVLGTVAKIVGFNIFTFLSYIKDELFLVLGTRSSESALPGLMEKLEKLGCRNSTVGIVVPAGWSFNLDGSYIYMTLAIVFISEILGIPLDTEQQIMILLVAMLTSKGASGIASASLVTLAATLSVADPRLLPGMAVVVGIDPFMSECKAITNVIGNGVATLVVSRWEKEMTREELALSFKQRMQG
jgi:aerobic C4-dicarboxylate transport protein